MAIQSPSQGTAIDCNEPRDLRTIELKSTMLDSLKLDDHLGVMIARCR
jgi:hypothetical protein